MNKNSVGTRKMRREDYKKVKKMDRQQFENFCRCLYEEGQQDGINSVKGVDIEEVREAVQSVRGVGKGKAELIVNAIEARFKENEH